MSADAGPARIERIVCQSGEEFAERAAEFMAHVARSAVDRRGLFTVALAGGTTPRVAYSLLAGSSTTFPVDWARTYLFFTDERLVAHDDPNSNFAMVRQSLLEPAGIPDDHVFPIPTGLASAAMCAQAYEETLMEFFGTHVLSTPPRFDLVVLGIGEDGHTASLFPGSPAMDVTDRWAVATSPGTLPPHVERVTLTFPVLNAARAIVFLATGPKKAEVVRDVFESRPSRGVLPVDKVSPVDGQVTWMIDAGAASLLTSKSRSRKGSHK